jgi:hypothetical protein
LPRVRLSGKTYLFGRRVHVNSHRAGGGRNRPHPVTRHRNTGGCSERVAHFFCGLQDPLWLCRSHYVLARISRKSRCAECEREHDTCESNRRTAQATKPVSYSHAVNVIPFRICASLFRDYSRQRSDSFWIANYLLAGFRSRAAGMIRNWKLHIRIFAKRDQLKTVLYGMHH